MKKVYLLAAIITTVFFANAQGQNDPVAKKILDAVSNKFKTFKSPSASFTYKVENAQGKTLSSKKGSVAMKGSKYKVTMPGLEIFSDGHTQWSYDKSAKEVTVKSVDESQSEISPQKLFTNFFDKIFLYKLNGEKKVGNKTLQEIELTPTDKNRPFFKVYALVDKATQTLYSAKFLEKSGNRYSYTIDAMNPNANLNDAQFTFDKKRYPGVELVDLR
ncbi:MAG: outer membrane lipoprotein carrier protein LolA [Chitinophagaceae bacterium]